MPPVLGVQAGLTEQSRGDLAWQPAQMRRLSSNKLCSRFPDLAKAGAVEEQFDLFDGLSRC